MLKYDRVIDDLNEGMEAASSGLGTWVNYLLFVSHNPMKLEMGNVLLFLGCFTPQLFSECELCGFLSRFHIFKINFCNLLIDLSTFLSVIN